MIRMSHGDPNWLKLCQHDWNRIITFPTHKAAEAVTPEQRVILLERWEGILFHNSHQQSF